MRIRRFLPSSWGSADRSRAITHSVPDRTEPVHAGETDGPATGSRGRQAADPSRPGRDAGPLTTRRGRWTCREPTPPPRSRRCHRRREWRRRGGRIARKAVRRSPDRVWLGLRGRRRRFRRTARRRRTAPAAAGTSPPPCC